MFSFKAIKIIFLIVAGFIALAVTACGGFFTFVNGIHWTGGLLVLPVGRFVGGAFVLYRCVKGIQALAKKEQGPAPASPLEQTAPQPGKPE